MGLGNRISEDRMTEPTEIAKRIAAKINAERYDEYCGACPKCLRLDEGLAELIDQAGVGELYLAMKALHDLTPGGSEFANDVKRCVAWIRERQHSQHDMLIKAVKGRQAAEAGVGELVEALRLLSENVQAWIDDMPADISSLRRNVVQHSIMQAEAALSKHAGRATEPQGDKK